MRRFPDSAPQHLNPDANRNAGFSGRSFLRRQREGVGPWRGSRRSSGIVSTDHFPTQAEYAIGDHARRIATSISRLNHPQDWKEQEWRPKVRAMNPERANPL